MHRAELLARIHHRVRHRLGYRANLRRVSFALDRYSRQLFDGPYEERAPSGPRNLQAKLDRQAAGGPFEPYSITLINRGAAQLLGDERRIAEVGAGTGMFASFVARDSWRHITASEFDPETLQWAQANRAASNITYCRDSLHDWTGKFDLVLALEVIEHIDAYGSFLRSLAAVAPRAILSTPNRNRDAFASVARTPEFSEHVREWTAGEFFWVLRAFYSTVELFTVPQMDDQVERLRADPSYRPQIMPCTDLTTEAALLARCSQPI